MFMEAVEKAGINGVIAGVGTQLYFGTDIRVESPLGGGSMPLFVLTGLVGAAGSLIGDGLHLAMKDVVPISKKANDRMSVLTGAAINGLSFAVLLYAYKPAILRDIGTTTAVLTGAAAEFGGSAAYSYLKENQYF